MLRSTRLRVALVSALTSAIALGAGAYWFTDRLQQGFEDTASRLASEQGLALKQLLEAGVTPTALGGSEPYGLYEIFDSAGNRLASCPQWPNGLPVGGYLAPPDGQNSPWERTVTLDLPPPPGYATPDFTATSCTEMERAYVYGRQLQVHISTLKAVGERYTVYTATSISGQESVDTIRNVLWGVVPGTSLLIGAVAWFAVRRPLRSVEGIRAEVAEIRAADLGRRVPVPNSGDEITSLAETMNDMLARLERSVRRQGQFTADASHELRTPLASIRTQLEVLMAHPEQVDWQHTCANTVLDVTRMQDLVSDLLLLSKLDASRQSRSEPVPMAELVTAFAADRTPRAGITVNLEITGTPVIDGNPPQLERLLRNLVDNAERHAATTVTVRLNCAAEDCVLTVSDDGPGIPAEDRQRVFDRFVRLDDSRSAEDGGSGLGLAIAAEIAHAHGGTLTVADSETGACLLAWLPAHRTAG